ncbi:MAG: ATP-binding protein, partial [Lachnospiraceae bacterium]|nr:ATP-binding protein [Lachnospiraceae bacterium]
VEGPAVAVPVTAEGRSAAGAVELPKAKYVDFETGAFYNEKPEHMTQLYGNKLVRKNHRRIVFRGYLDDLEAELLLAQTELEEKGGYDVLVADLEDVANTFREMMRADCLNDAFKKPTMLGLDHAQLRERSHNPMKFYNIKQMLLPSKDLGRVYALLNNLRTKIRKTEVAAVSAYENGSSYERTDIIEELNRASSAMHIMMCKYLAGDYNH